MSIERYTGGEVTSYRDRQTFALVRRQAIIAQGQAAIAEKRIDNGITLAHEAIDRITGLHRHISQATYENPSLELELREIEAAAATACGIVVIDYIRGR